MTDHQQAELEQERLERIIEALDRVATGFSNYDTARFLAAELGVRHLWLKQPKENQHGKSR
jgi:hypothetical protein